jgi:hypothetical protein
MQIPLRISEIKELFLLRSSTTRDPSSEKEKN